MHTPYTIALEISRQLANVGHYASADEVRDFIVLRKLHSNATPRQLHTQWLINKTKRGWKAGDWNPATKTSSVMTPFDSLAPEATARQILIVSLFDNQLELVNFETPQRFDGIDFTATDGMVTAVGEAYRIRETQRPGDQLHDIYTNATATMILTRGEFPPFMVEAIDKSFREYQEEEEQRPGSMQEQGYLFHGGSAGRIWAEELAAQIREIDASLR